MKNITKLLLASAIALFIGCDGEVSSTPTVVKTNAVQTLDTTKFNAGTGAVTEDVEIVAGNGTDTTMKISDGTVFRDENNNTITKAPEAKVAVEKTATEAKTTIDFTSDGKKVIPTESVVISVPAPTGAKPGDEVQIEVGDDKITAKLIYVTVKADGTVDIRVFPSVFGNKIVIVVKKKVDSSTN